MRAVQPRAGRVRRAAIVLALAAVLSAPVRAAETGNSGAYVPPLRIFDTDLKLAVRAARRRSPTLDRLLEHLGEFRAIVVVQWTAALPAGVEAATLPHVIVTPEVLYLHIGIRPVRVTDHLVSVLAHEVQHAIEILESRMTDSAAIVGLFKQRAGGITKRVYCTPAAAEAGRAVFEELRKAPP